MTDGFDEVRGGAAKPAAKPSDRPLRRPHLGDGEREVVDGDLHGRNEGPVASFAPGARRPLPYPGTPVSGPSPAPSLLPRPSLVGIPQGAVPYLGPIPPPGRFMETYALAISAAVAAVWLVRALAFLPLVSSAQRLLDEADGVLSTDTAEFTRNAALVDLLWLVGLVGGLGTVVVHAVWRSKRRPKGIVRTYGESYVEAPAKVYLTAAYRVASVAFVVVTYLGFQAGRIGRTTLPSAMPGKFLFMMGASITLALAFGFEAYAVRIARRHTDDRLAWSGPYRENPSAVPYVAPVASGGAFEGSSGQNSSGIGWIFTTLGLSMLGIIGGIAFIAGITSLGGKDRVPAAISLLVGAAMIGLLGWRIKVRREKKAQERAAANTYGLPRLGDAGPGPTGPPGPSGVPGRWP